MDDIRGDFLQAPYGTTPAVLIANKIKTEFKSFYYINEREDGPYRGFGFWFKHLFIRVSYIYANTNMKIKD